MEDAPENGMPPLAVRDGKNLYPTGQYFVVKQNAAKRIFEVDVEKGMGVMMEAEAYDSFIADMKAQGLLDDGFNPCFGLILILFDITFFSFPYVKALFPLDDVWFVSPSGEKFSLFCADDGSMEGFRLIPSAQ